MKPAKIRRECILVFSLKRAGNLLLSHPTKKFLPQNIAMRTLGSFTRPLLTSILGPVCIALPALNPQPCTCFAQGSLTPPGAPAPTMKSLDQLEPRTDVLKLSGDGANSYIISQPGSYYLTTNVL